MTNLKYYSTNNQSNQLSFKEALLQGQAPDRGLYLPEKIPLLTTSEINAMKEMQYYEIATNVLKNYADLPEEKLTELTKTAYNFEIPLEKIHDRNYVMRLDQGPTCSFKDFAARLMAQLMQHYLKEEDKTLTILTATSGDTGSAVANAFHNVKNVKVIVLFPKDEVSEVQRKQITTLNGNIDAIAINGKFDDCQSLVKQAFNDPTTINLNLSSANSINIGRLLPQMIYYFYAYSRLASEGEKITITVPSGNFGNLTAGLIAKKMGLPVQKFIAAVNENDEFPNYLKTKTYTPVTPSENCISNAMNVGNPSNLPRIVKLYNGEMNEKGQVTKNPNFALLNKDIYSTSVTNEETLNTMKNVYEKYDVLLEPHGAVAWHALNEYLKIQKTSNTTITLETAHPAKFKDAIKTATKLDIKYPPQLKQVLNQNENYQQLPPNYEELKNYLTKTNH